MRSRSIPLVEVYVWQLPVRFYHWVNALAILGLVVTGLIIGNPPGSIVGPEASSTYWFGIVRFVHFICAWVFFFNFVFRIYWGFVGNKFAKWDNFIPFRKCQYKEMEQVIKIDVLQVSSSPMESMGHNALAATTYFVLFLFFVLMSLTGFALYAGMSTWWFPKMFNWVTMLLGGDMEVRHIHHLMMWGFILFAMIHIYLTVYHDYIERRGIISSMIGGWKFIEKNVFDYLTTHECPPEPKKKNTAKN
jgi:Ni/Fe-hydrogenase 1 B-type cytochrome subunit